MKRQVVLEAVYTASPERVWRALTDDKALTRWLLPNDFQPRPGHRFRFTPKPGKGGGGAIDCKVVALEKEKRLAYTWQEADAPPMLVCWTLEAVAEGTRVRLEHTGIEATSALPLATEVQARANWTHAMRVTLPAVLKSRRQAVRERPYGLLLLPNAPETVRCVSRRLLSAT